MGDSHRSDRAAARRFHEITRRDLMKGAGSVALGAGALAATGPTRARAADFKGTTVTVAVGSFMSGGVSMFKDEWQKRTGGRIEVVEIPFGDLYQRLFAAFTTGAEQFDVAIYASNWIPEFAQAKKILSLEKYYPEKDNWSTVLPSVQKIMYVEKERYTVPLDGDIIIGYYRTDALDDQNHKKRFADKYKYELAPPQTWQQYRDIAEFFTGWDWSNSGKRGWGVLEAQKPKDVGPYIFISRAAAYAANPTLRGSLFFDPDTMEPQIANPGWVEALNDWIEIRKFGPPEMATYGGGEMRGNFIAGHYALGIDWADVGIMAQDESASIIKGKLGYFVLPGASKVWNLKTRSWQEFDKPQQAPFQGWGGWHGSIAANSKNAHAAWDFLNFIDSTPNAFRAVTTPGTARNPYRTDHFTNVQGWVDSPVHYKDPKPYLDTISQALNHPNAQTDLRIPQSGRYFEVLDQWAQEALAGTLKPAEALQKAAAEWGRITKDAGLEQQKRLYRDLYSL
jgi:multiple sugar transport system substrate-binding protein